MIQKKEGLFTLHCENERETALLAREIFWLAWQASQAFGMGLLQDNPTATKEQVWNNILCAGDYPGRSLSPHKEELSADYVFGRPIKLVILMEKNRLELRDTLPHEEYQGWALKYPTVLDLITAAKENICDT